jgi:hypothetical protein
MRLKIGTKLLFTGQLWTVTEFDSVTPGIPLVRITREGGRGLTWRRDALVARIHDGAIQLMDDLSMEVRA